VGLAVFAGAERALLDHYLEVASSVLRSNRRGVACAAEGIRAKELEALQSLTEELRTPPSGRTVGGGVPQDARLQMDAINGSTNFGTKRL
jgi:hypothetical protein